MCTNRFGFESSERGCEVTTMVQMISVHAATIYYTVWARLLTQE